MSARLVFWLFAGALAYVYVLYPLLVRVMAACAGRAVRRARGLRPTVTVIVTAYNEQKNIAAKLDNILSLDYPRELLDVIVASDASSDATDAIVRAHPSGQVRLLRVEGRRGKTACQNQAVDVARGEIVVFTDATTRIDRDALAAMVENFGDPEVGCVAGLLVYVGKGENLTASGGVSYWGYEVSLRRAESRLGSLIGVSGCFYAVRKAAYRPIDPNSISDFVIAMRMREQGLRTVLEEHAVCYEETLDRSDQELSMRVRVALRSISALVGERRFLYPLRYPQFSWQLWSHKVLRYIAPYCLLAMLGASLYLLDEPLYLGMLMTVAVVFLAGIVGFVLRVNARHLGLIGRPYYFLLANLAAIIAMLRYVRGERMTTWNPLR